MSDPHGVGQLSLAGQCAPTRERHCGACGPRPQAGTIGADALPPGIVSRSPEKQTLQEARQRFERGYVRGVLAQAGGRRGKAALALGVTRQGLAKLLKRLDLDAAAGGPSEAAVDATQTIS